MRRYEPGQRVRDREERRDKSPMRVVKHHDIEAREFHIEGVGTNVYLANQQYGYPPTATVVSVCYESQVGGKTIRRLEEGPNHPMMVVDAHGVQTYAFPAPRLERIEDEKREMVA